MNRNDLQRLSRIRLKEAKALLRSENFSGAYYLAGYSLECALKSCIAKSVRKYDFPDKPLAVQSYTHDLQTLLKITELDSALSAGFAADDMLAANWSTAKSWTEAARYEIHTRSTAQAMIDAVGNPRHGVLPWIKRHW